jgi:DNA-binding GntR family transcriptional regulator
MPPRLSATKKSQTAKKPTTSRTSGPSRASRASRARRPTADEPVVALPSASEAAYAQLRDEIVLCELAPGDRITESEVARRIGLGKTPVREALRRLMHEGLVLVRPRQSYVVAPITLADVEELCALRLIVEPAAVTLAAGRLDASRVATLDRLSRVGYDLADPASIRAFHQANRTLHTTIAQASGNARLAALVDQLLVELQRMIQFGLLVHPRSDSGASVARHVALVNALRRGHATAARQLVEREIRATERMVTESLMRHTSVRRIAIT